MDSEPVKDSAQASTATPDAKDASPVLDGGVPQLERQEEEGKADSSGAPGREAADSQAITQMQSTYDKQK